MACSRSVLAIRRPNWIATTTPALVAHQTAASGSAVRLFLVRFRRRNPSARTTLWRFGHQPTGHPLSEPPVRDLIRPAGDADPGVRIIR